MKNDCEVRVRLPKNIKDEFAKMCEDELIGMSVKIRQIIIGELKKKNDGRKSL